MITAGMKRGMVFILALCAVFAVPWVAHAQETTLGGTIADSTGAVLPGVTVTATHVETGNTFLGVSDTSGEYRIGTLRPGVYKLTIELPGFATLTRDNLELLLGQRATINFEMKPSTVQETITVTGEAPLVDVTRTRMGGNIDRRQMEELPVLGRNWMDLSILAPGARTNHVDESPTLGMGTRTDSKSFQLNLDGQQVTNMVSAAGFGQPRYSRDLIAEFEIVTNRFDATQGRSMLSHVNAITKSGTNTYAGSVSGYFRDDSLNAKDFIVGRVLPYSSQQVSGTFGGPIKRDRMHFFANHEYEREPQAFTFTDSLAAVQPERIRRLRPARTQGRGAVRQSVQRESAADDALLRIHGEPTERSSKHRRRHSAPVCQRVDGAGEPPGIWLLHAGAASNADP